jgi:hypothetical protein
VTEQEFAAGWKLLMSNPWPKEPPQGAKGLFFGAVAHLTAEQWGRTVQAVLRACTHFPAMAELLKHVPGAPVGSATDAESAWERVCRSARSGPRGPYSPASGSPPSGADLDERTLAAGRSVGLRRIEAALYANTPDAIGYVRRDFLAAWEAHRDADRAGVLTPSQADVRRQLDAAPERLALPPAFSDAERVANARRIAGLLGEALTDSPPSAQDPPDVAGRYQRALDGADEVPAEVRAADSSQQRLDQRERFRQWQAEFEARQAAADGRAA